MFRNFSKSDLVIVAILLDEEEVSCTKNVQQKSERKRKIWVYDILKKRKTEGEFATLCHQLEDHEDKFFKYFRMSRFQFNTLYLKIKNKISKQNTQFRESIPAKEKIGVCLRFLSTGDSYQTIAFSFRLGHSTVQGIVIEVCDAIILKLKEECIKTPQKEDWERIANKFWEFWNFPNCIGALDGKHVMIEAPPNTGSLYFNYKKNFSIVLLALVDAQYKFTVVDVGAFGKNSDGGILSHSNFGKNKLNIPNNRALPGTNEKLPYVIIGDEAFPLKNYLLRPYSGPQMYNDVKKKKIFNERLSRARKVVEDAFGQLTAKFRIYCRRLKSLPENADKIVMTTCILHNYIKEDSSGIHTSEVADTTSLGNLSLFSKQGGSAQSQAFEYRDQFKDFFNSPTLIQIKPPKLPWE
ncbi:protein ALP1-like [Melanaphis sacchari]|uniref:protein ALP1-like n=1 Tax=Melanaphis sacchari TaxID=742174 RepID=UPI000DC1411D|nr:protein ALP1-like [Melanaphis sacchari]